MNKRDGVWGKRTDGSAPRAVHRNKAYYKPFILLRVFFFVYSSFSLQSSIHLTIGVLKIQVLVLPIHIQIETHTSTQHSFQCKSLKSFVMGLGAFFFFFKCITGQLQRLNQYLLDEYTGNERNMAIVTHLPAWTPWNMWYMPLFYV